MKVAYRATRRKAITPIIATVLIIAVTLIAAVAIGGFVFGIFGSATSVAQVTVVGASLSHTLTVTSLAATCSATGSGSYLQLSNTGTASTVASTLSMTYGGNTYTSTLPTSCTVGSGSSEYVIVSALPVAPNPGTQFTGFVVMSNGAQVVYTGVFS
jgi:flagellin-like protein